MKEKKISFSDLKRESVCVCYQGDSFWLFLCQKIQQIQTISAFLNNFSLLLITFSAIFLFYFIFFFFSSFFLSSGHEQIVFFYSVNAAKKRKIYDTRGMNKSSYHSHGHSYSHHSHHNNHDYSSSSAHRRGNRYSGFTFRGLFEPTPFYKIFGIIK